MGPVVCSACGYDPALPVLHVADLVVSHSYPSQNQLGANGRGKSGWHYRRFRQEFAAALHSALSAVTIPRAVHKRRVWIKRIYRPGKRPYDVANLLGGGKALVDVLVSRGLLKDDSPKWFEGIYAQEPGPADQIQLAFYDVLP